MTRLAAAACLAFAFGLVPVAAAAGEYRTYTVTFTKSQNGTIQAEKDPGVFYFEINYGYGTDWTFVNNTGVAIDVQFQEGPSRSMCHLRFSPAGSVFCESQVMQLTPSGPGQSTTLHADALDLWPYEYCYAFDRCPGEVRVGLHGQVLVPVDPDLQIDRDYLFDILTGTIVVSALALGYLMLRRQRRRRLSGRPGNPAAS